MKTLCSFLITLLILSCSQRSENVSSEQNNGKLLLALNMNGAPPEVDKIKGRLSRNNTVIEFDFSINGFVANAEVDELFPGSYQLVVDALNSDSVVIYTGSAQVMINAGQISQVSLDLSATTGGIEIEVHWPQPLNQISGSIYYVKAWYKWDTYSIDDNFINIHFPLSGDQPKEISINDIPLTKYPNWPLGYVVDPSVKYSKYPYIEEPYKDANGYDLTSLYRYFWYWGFIHPQISSAQSVNLKIVYDNHNELFNYVMPTEIDFNLDSITSLSQSTFWFTVGPAAANSIDSVYLIHELDIVVDDSLQVSQLSRRSRQLTSYGIAQEASFEPFSIPDPNSVDVILNRFYLVVISKKSHTNETINFTTALEYHKSSALRWTKNGNQFTHLFDTDLNHDYTDNWPKLSESSRRQ